MKYSLEKLRNLIAKPPEAKTKGAPPQVLKELRALNAKLHGTAPEFREVLESRIAESPVLQSFFAQHTDLYKNCVQLANDRLEDGLSKEERAYQNNKDLNIKPLVARYRGALMAGLEDDANQLDGLIEFENNKLEEDYAKRQSIALGSAIVALHGECDRLQAIAQGAEAARIEKEETAYRNMSEKEINIAILKELRARK
jgi:inactivated superfamily I helicase